MSANRKKSEANYGIQANQVSAEVLAVGPKAKAIKTGLGTEAQQQLLEAVQQIQRAVNSLQMDPQARAGINQEVESLHAATSAADVRPDRVSNILESLSGKLKIAGIVLSDVIALSEPLHKLASMLNITL